MSSKPKRLRISKFSGLSRIYFAVFALLFAGVGIYLINNSKAGSLDATINVHIIGYGSLNGANIAGVSVTVSPLGAGSGCSGSLTKATDSTGYARWICNSGYNYGVTNNGGGGYAPIGTKYVAFTLGAGEAENHTLTVESDSDNDGIGNSVDDCISTAGVAANKGCPNGTLTSFQGPGTVTANTTFNLTWSDNGYTSNCNVSPKPGAINTSGTVTVSGGISSTTQFALTCSQSQVSGNAAVGSPMYTTVTVAGTTGCGSSCPANATFTTNLTATPTSVDNGGKTTLNWALNNAKSCYLSYIDTAAATTTQLAVNSSQTWTSPGLTSATTFTLSCSGLNGGSSASQHVGVTINGSTTQPPPPPPPVKVTTSTSSKVVKRSGGVVSTGSDKERPTAPTNLVAEQIGGSSVDLTWTASTDNVGVVSYSVERSGDGGSNWEMLDEAVTDTAYTDDTANYGTSYSYRVSAADAAGNYSDYAVVDLTTNSFEANVKADEDTTITSDDGIVEVTFPAGALDEDAYCEITKDSVSSNPKGYKLVAGGYTITCRNAAGDTIDSINKPLRVVMHLKDYTKKYGKFAAYAVGDQLSAISSTFNSKTGDLNFDLKELQTFAAFGAKKGSTWWIWVLLILLIIGIIFLIRRLRGGGGGDEYYDTTDYVSMPPSASVGPLDTGAGGYQHHPTLPELVAQGGQQPPQPGPGPGQYPPYPPQTPPQQ